MPPESLRPTPEEAHYQAIRLENITQLLQESYRLHDLPQRDLFEATPFIPIRERFSQTIDELFRIYRIDTSTWGKEKNTKTFTEFVDDVQNGDRELFFLTKPPTNTEHTLVTKVERVAMTVY